MIREAAMLRLLPGAAPAFERAFASVAPLLAGTDGCLSYRLMPTLESPEIYLIEVDCRDLAAHTEGFEPSEAHARFMAPLEPLLLGEPIVVHVPVGEPEG
ncbi:hypothetical protein ASE63_04155 [Bosea sp. Root381]|uniref:antibiotic biosynthesis monooxygenase family protein n=1 Tax=Bosea sp. Root381 TaxID=1736524 RepID=UPI0006FA1B1C|nr:antibiotic biosynthesis monooxygenase [Bosea sp. Root381]KRE09728.1 hypothetical protein ASE63_04155 [Bosea sp. Root381]